jgi:hypothetical protein
LHKKLFEILLGSLLTDASNKDLASLLLLITRDGALGINLEIRQKFVQPKRRM